MKRIVERITFDESVLKERWEKIFQYKNLPIYDAFHVPERLAQRHSRITMQTFFKKLEKGLRKIEKQYSLDYNTYMIISYRTNLKIQLEIRPDRKHDEKAVGVVSTVLDAKKHPFNKYDDIEVYIEQSIQKGIVNPYELDRLAEASKRLGYFRIIESDGFSYFFADGEVTKSFVEINVDTKD